MTTGPVLAVLVLSDSFRSLWDDLASETGADPVILGPGDTIPSTAAVAVIAAGGEEDQGLDLLAQVIARAGVPVYLVGARPSHRFAVETMRCGAADYFSLPDDLDILRRAITARIEARSQRARRSGEHRAGPDAFAALVGESPQLKATIDKASRVIEHPDITVLIGGETGTGKELLARALHDGGPRADRPFVAVNCAAIPEHLMESELFGHERGAFTDAHQAKPGLFEEADGGTLFLDEIGQLHLPLQGKLLRALDDKQVRRVGANRSRSVDVRIIAATHVDLERAVKHGEFREDLFYRLNVVSLTLPPLRDRGGDVVRLATAFCASLAQRYGMPAPEITPEVRASLERHSWPGNVRELRHAIERALLLSKPGSLDPAELTPTSVRGSVEPSALPFPATLDSIEAAAARAAVESRDGNKSAAARLLGISRSRLQRLLEIEGGADAGAE